MPTRLAELAGEAAHPVIFSEVVVVGYGRGAPVAFVWPDGFRISNPPQSHDDCRSRRRRYTSFVCLSINVWPATSDFDVVARAYGWALPTLHQEWPSCVNFTPACRLEDVVRYRY